MKVITTQQMRDLERRAMTEFQVPGETLMDRAGYGVAMCVDRLYPDPEATDVLLIAGRGNNGGDAFVAARYLKEWGFHVQVWLAGALQDVRGDARVHMTRLKTAGVKIEEFPTQEDWDDVTLDPCASSGGGVSVVVDGVLGTGLDGPARGPAAGAIRYINSLTREARVVAVDVPSGLHSDSGLAEGEAVYADVTVTMGLAKRGLVQPHAIDHVGRLEVMDIGLPWCLIDKLEAEMELIVATDLRPLLPRRPRMAHKGHFGHVLLIGGAGGCAGAMVLAARAALRSGAGLVSVLTPRGIAAMVLNGAPEAMVHGGRETDAGALTAEAWAEWRTRQNQINAILIGPGLTRQPAGVELTQRVLQESVVPVVMDADALNAFEGRVEALAERTCPLVLTPHPGEMARLMGCTAPEVQADRLSVAAACAGKTHAVVVLKGAGTLIAEDGRPLHVNLNGNPGMATGGMGDVLAGLLTGLIGQGLAPFDAARLAVYIHSQAADEAAIAKSEACLTAGDVIEMLPVAFRFLSPR